jgi:putative addiction module CopG family antidote
MSMSNDIMTIKLSEEREQFIRSLVADGRFASESEVVDEAMTM